MCSLPKAFACLRTRIGSLPTPSGRRLKQKGCPLIPGCCAPVNRAAAALRGHCTELPVCQHCAESPIAATATLRLILAKSREIGYHERGTADFRLQILDCRFQSAI